MNREGDGFLRVLAALMAALSILAAITGRSPTFVVAAGLAAITTALIAR